MKNVDVPKLASKIKSKITKKRLFVVLGAVVIFLGLLVADFYFYNLTRKITWGICRYVPLPVAIIDREGIITTRQLISNTQAIKNFYENQDFSDVGMRVDFATKEGKFRLKTKEKEVLDKLIENRIVENIAESYNLHISEKEARQDLAVRIANSGREAKGFALDIRKLYNWSLNDFVEQIIIPEMYLNKLYDYYNENIKNQSEAYKKINQAATELEEDSSNFEEVAKKYSEGSSAENGGELGWFEKGQIVPEVAEVVFEMEPGQHSEIVESPLGFHIVYLEKIRKSESGENLSKEKKEVKIKQIHTKSGGFFEWFLQQKRQADVIILMKDYKWEKETAMIEFRDENLQRQEENIIQKSEGDPSVY